jgi:hypothetical protein
MNLARTPLCLAALSAVALGACNGGPANPPRLYLHLLDSELTVQLQPEEPPPF